MPPDASCFSWGGSGGTTADSPLAFFADESGNTGKNHLDPDQPYYVAAGWLLRRSDVPRASSLVHDSLSKSEMGELKGRKLVKTTKGRRVLRELLPALLAFCTPLSVVIEKRYSLCIRMVQDFVIYPGGPLFPHRPDRATTRELATLFVRLGDELMVTANAYVADPTREMARACAQVLGEGLEGMGEQGLATVVRGSMAAPEAWWSRNDILKRSMAPNVLAYTTILQNLEVLGVKCGQPISLVHDELQSLQHVYEFYSEYAAATDLSQSAGFAQAEYPGRVLHVGMPEFCNSNDEPLVQAADALCALSTSFLTGAGMASEPAAREIRELAVLLLWGFVEPELRRYFMFIGDDDTGMRFGQTLVDWSSEFTSA